jgi:DNA polymerase-3 subunit beta
MKFTLTRQALLDPVLLASSMAPTRSVKPILQNLRLDASEEFLEIQGTDLDLSIRVRVAHVEVQEPGSALLPAAKLAMIVREMPDGPIEFGTDQFLCKIRGGGASFRLQGADPDEFPEVAGFEEGKGDLQLPADTLRMMSRKTAFAVSAEKTRYALNGVLFTARKDGLRMVATDGRRLAMVETQGMAEIDGEHEAVVPPKALTQLERVLTPEDEFVAVGFEDGQLRVRTQRATIGARLIEGKFPNLDSILPAPGEIRVAVDREELIAGVRRAAIMTTEESKPVRVSISSDRLVVSARSGEVGDAEVEIPIDGPAQGIEIGFNPAYLIDGLKAVLDLSAPNKAGRIVGDPGYVYVIMPINLG